MTRERWMLGGAGVLVVLLVVVGTVLIVSGDGDTKISVTATTTSSTIPPTTTTTSTESPSVTIGIVCTTPEEAAMSFIDAWIAGDEAAAARCAAPAAVAKIFETSGAGAQYMFQGCFGDDPALPDCAYTYEGGSAHLAVTGTEAAGWQVQSLSYVAD
ncbi:MAG: hypothetical protein EXQ79_03870 [Acidimicrobiia bacterium]|nr:hypothetical protein [Acidimicrobiia bacterium]